MSNDNYLSEVHRSSYSIVNNIKDLTGLTLFETIELNYLNIYTQAGLLIIEVFKIWQLS